MTKESDGSNNKDEGNIFSSPEAFQIELDKVSGADNATDNETGQDDDDIDNKGDELDKDLELLPEDDDLDDNDDPDDKIPVSKKRLDQEIKKRKEAKSAAEAAHDEAVRAKHELESYKTALEQYFKKPDEEHPKGDEEEEIDALDPDAYNALKKKIAKLEEKLTTKEENDNITAAQSAFREALRGHREEFTKEHPDLQDAFKHVQVTKYNEYLEQGYSEAEAKHMTMQELQQKTAKAWQNGKNTAELVYNMAKRSGYTPKSSSSRPNKGEVDLEVLDRNIKKSASISDTPAASTSSGIDLKNKDDVTKNMTKNGSGFIDPDKFMRLVEREQRRRR